jgi:Skp family chaperone for outer membrane proteins
MHQKHAVAIAVVAAVALAFFSGASVTPGRATPADERKPEEARPPVVVGQKTAVFNMAAVMREFHFSKYQVWLLNEKKFELSRNLLKIRAEYTELIQELQRNPNDPDKDEKEKQRLKLFRAVEDEERDIPRQLNADASAIISDLYDKIKAVVDGLAKENGYQIVLAYPDAVTPEEINSPYMKELKLKPPAAQPFYVAPEVNVTARIVKALNEKYPPVDPKTSKPVDVDRLVPRPVPQAAPAPPVVPAPGPGQFKLRGNIGFSPRGTAPNGPLAPAPPGRIAPDPRARFLPLPPIPAVPGPAPKSGRSPAPPLPPIPKP